MDCKPLFEKSVKAARSLIDVSTDQINEMLLSLAALAVIESEQIIEENRKDLNLMDQNDKRYDRLKLNTERISAIAADIRNVATLPSPLGLTDYSHERPDGLKIKRISVPFGVIGVIYEARPNVTFDVFSLCIKAGNSCILKGGSDARHSNIAITLLIKRVLQKYGINEDVISLMPDGRAETGQLLNARGYVDLIIPRGSQGLIDFVRENSGIPVIETGAGICHTYFDESGNTEKGRMIINNAKTRRVSVCNALDCLVIHKSRLSDLSRLIGLCAASDVIVYADEESYRILDGEYPAHLLERATEESFGTEFLDYKMSVKTVGSFEEALVHISEFSSHHSEAIIAEDAEKVNAFCRHIDAAVVYTNSSTAFTDGAQFGLGAEIGISTQKLHARGPMALQALTTTKWIVNGSGQIRT
jgi:glutamate-5-semialdehyde dehydrogenase